MSELKKDEVRITTHQGRETIVNTRTGESRPVPNPGDSDAGLLLGLCTGGLSWILEDLLS